MNEQEQLGSNTAQSYDCIAKTIQTPAFAQQEYFNSSAAEFITLIDGLLEINGLKIHPGEMHTIFPGAPTIIKSLSPSKYALHTIDPTGRSKRERLITRTADAENSPKISIIVTAFNVQDYIGITLNSILSQTYKNIEIIIVDDKSTDQTKEIIKDFSIRYDCIQPILKIKNEGGSLAKKTGLSASTGEYFLFCDGDDIIENDTIARAVAATEGGYVDCVIFGFDHLDNQTGDRHNKVLPQQTSKLKASVNPKDIRNANGLAKISHITTTCLLKSSIHKEGILNSLINIPYFYDIPTFCSMVAKSKAISLLDAPLYHYRVNRPGQSISNWATNDRGRKNLSLLTALQACKNTHEKKDICAQVIIFEKSSKIISDELQIQRKNLSSHHYKLTLKLYQKIARELPNNTLPRQSIKARILNLCLKSNKQPIRKLAARRIKI